MKDTTHMRPDFYSVAWAMPPGWDFGALGVPRGSQFFFSNMVIWLIKSTDRMLAKFSSQGQNGDLRVRSKGQISLNFNYHVNSKIFIPNFVCVLTNKI